MNATISATVQALQHAEHQLREQMQTAAKQGDYETLTLITGVAKKVAELATEVQSASGEPLDSPRIPPPPPKLVPPRLLKGYPKFFRNGDALVKIGWSKSEKAEYEHRAPIPVLNCVVAAIEGMSKRQRFPMESVISTIFMPGGAEIPTYQTYLCLAWLRQEALVIQHGRQGYSVKSGIQLSTEVRARFAQLPDISARNLAAREEKAQ